MPKRLTPQSPLPVAIAALFTFGFVGCLSETRSLNDNPAANGGEEGEDPAAGTGGKSGAGTGGGARAGTSGMGTGGRSEVGGSSGAFPHAGSSFAGAGAQAGAPNGGAAGSPNGGVPNGGVGASAGYAGGFSGAGPMAGASGGAGAPSCVVRSTDSGCDGRGFCLDHELDSCSPDYTSDECSGTCAVPYLTPICSGFDAVECPQDFECLPDTDTAQGTDPTSICVGGRSPDCVVATDCADGFSCLGTPDGMRCVPDRADCIPGLICDSGIPSCPPAYAPADAQLCDYVCVPFQHCGCAQDLDCPQPAYCDRENGRCLVPRAPAPRCSEPFDAGPCDAAAPVYAFVDGECKAEVYGGCEGNDNRFATLEECLSSCQGMPIEQSCPGSRKAALGCLGCGGGGGCLLWGQFCFEPCESSDDCTPGYSCNGGLCQIGPCA